MTASSIFWKVMFYAFVVIVVVFAVFPFYYAIITSFATGAALFEIHYWPSVWDLSNYKTVIFARSFPRAILNSLVHRLCYGRLCAVPCRHRILRPGAGAVPGQGAVVDDDPWGVDVPADRRSGGPV